VKLPRNVTGRQLAAALATLGYTTVRQRGSHIHLVTPQNGEHHLAVPDHHPLKPGTLNAILRSLAEHHGLSKDELTDRLEL
jgi:predicted RNA binding protein YcfA (HicA-like mRNA interferase family)